MTDNKSCKRDLHLWWALGIALAAFTLRICFINFATDSHPDEPIIGNLSKQFVEKGILTADWAGFKDEWWSHPTYQFSPYTLLQSLIAKTVSWVYGPRQSLDHYIILARVTSCFWGGLSVFLVYLLGRICFSPGAALLGEATMAMCFLAVQDSIYARVDSFLGCVVLVSVILAFQTAKRPGALKWLTATCFSMGVVVATKYNAIPALVLIPFVLYRWEKAGAVSRKRALGLALACALPVGLGFIIATPEILWRPGPLIAGMRFEAAHYSTGHIPHEAFGWADNNFYFWTQYLSWIGLGLLPTLFALLFVVRIIKFRRWEDFMLGTFLVISAVLVLVPKVRFERNLEICLGPLILAAAATAWDCIGWLNQRPNIVLARSVGVAFVALWFAQPVRVLYNFRQTLNFKHEWTARLDALDAKDGPIVVDGLLNAAIPPDWVKSGAYEVLLVDYGDPFSAANYVSWKQFLGREPAYTITSPWFDHNYPFSTVNYYHGALRTFVFPKTTNATSTNSAKAKPAH